MPFSQPLDAYTKIPTRTAAECLSLIRALIVAGNPKATAAIKARLSAMREAGVGLQAAWIAATRPQERKLSRRAYDKRLDRAWRKLRTRNADWMEIEDEERGERAAEIDALVFPTGLDFITFPYTEQWAESERRLKLIADEGLADELSAHVGERFMLELREAHADYGEILGITKRVDGADAPTRVVDALAAARQAMGSYARLVHALAEGGSEEEVAAAEQALEPIVRFRQLRPSTAGSEGEEGEESEEDEEIEDAASAPLPEIEALA